MVRSSALCCMSLFLAIFSPTNPTAINNFGGVFAIAFLCVLTAFACGAVLLKMYRAQLARMVIAKWWQIFVSLGAVLVGLIGKYLVVGFEYQYLHTYCLGFLLFFFIQATLSLLRKYSLFS